MDWPGRRIDLVGGLTGVARDESRLETGANHSSSWYHRSMTKRRYGLGFMAALFGVGLSAHAGCGGGACVCGAGLDACGGACFDLSTDPTHCGACGTACDHDQLCNAGVCGADCGTLTPCGGGCVDTGSDPQNCGGCGKVCGGGQI